MYLIYLIVVSCILRQSQTYEDRSSTRPTQKLAALYSALVNVFESSVSLHLPESVTAGSAAFYTDVRS